MVPRHARRRNPRRADRRPEERRASLFVPRASKRPRRRRLLARGADDRARRHRSPPCDARQPGSRHGVWRGRDGRRPRRVPHRVRQPGMAPDALVRPPADAGRHTPPVRFDQADHAATVRVDLDGSDRRRRDRRAPDRVLAPRRRAGARQPPRRPRDGRVRRTARRPRRRRGRTIWTRFGSRHRRTSVERCSPPRCTTR